MSYWSHLIQGWRKLSITLKFTLAFGTMLILMALIALTGVWALTTVQRQTEAAIVTSMEIQRLVLQMDSHLQQARRLEKEFFIHAPVDFEAARETYVEAYNQQIGQVIALTAQLQQLIDDPANRVRIRRREANLNTYLSLVNLYARSFNQAVELVAQLEEEDKGILAHLEQSSLSLQNTLQEANDPLLLAIYRQVQSFEKEYLLTRERPRIQSGFNTARLLREEILKSANLEAAQSESALAELDAYETVVKELLKIDNEIRTLRNGFDLQATAVEPISTALITQAVQGAEEGRLQISTASRVTIFIWGIIVVIAVALAAIVALRLNRSVTGNITKLTEAAIQLQQGNLAVRAQVEAADELGQLAQTFNMMASRIDTLVNELENQVTTAQNQLMEAIESISEGFSLYDAGDHLVLANSRYREMEAGIADLLVPGIQFEALMRAGAERGVYVEAIGRIDEWVHQRVAQHHQPQKPIERQVGDGRWLQTREYKTLDGGTVAIQSDITERKRAEKIQSSLYRISQAANSAEQLDDLFRITHSVIGGLMPAPNFQVILYEVETQTLNFAYRIDELDPSLPAPRSPGKGLVEYVLKRGEALLVSSEGLAELLDTGQIESVAGFPASWLGVPLSVNEEIIGLMAVYSYAENIRYGVEEKNILMLASNSVAMAIVRKWAEEALQASELLYKTLFDSAPVAIFTKDREGYYTSANTDLLDYWKPLNPIGFRDIDLLSPEIGEALRRNDLQVMESGQEQALEEEFITGYGDKRTVLSRKVPLRDAEDNVTGILGISVNITERKRAEEELQRAKDVAEAANRAKTQFLANMSHELRTPLNAIIGYSEILQEEAEEAGLAQFTADLEKIRGAGKHLLALISDVLDLSKIEAGKMELYLENFDISRMVQDVAETIRPLVEKNSNALTIDCPPDIGEMRADLTKTRQILFNLLSNATKFTEKGTITITVTQHSRPEYLAEAQNGHDLPLIEFISFRVTDNGIGIAEDQLETLFSAFTQADTSMTRRYGGTGLGLAITRHFCRMMGGDIVASSQLGQGSVFTIWLPVQVVAPQTQFALLSQQITLPEVEDHRVVSPHLRTVLVIDDDKTTHDLLYRYLGKEGFQVRAATDGETGLRLAKELKPAVITLDVMMAGMDGWTVLTRLQADQELADIPVIMLTIVNEKNMGYALGATDYLTKPIDRGRLVAVLKKYFDNQLNTVLLVEDDLVVREMVSRTLRKEHWQVVEAENGRVALEQLVKNQPRVIVLDLMMPEMDGFQFLEQLRENSSWRAIPIVVITAMDLTLEDRARLQGYVKHILQKGAYSRDQLLQEVRDLVSISYS